MTPSLQLKNHCNKTYLWGRVVMTEALCSVVLMAPQAPMYSLNKYSYSQRLSVPMSCVAKFAHVTLSEPKPRNCDTHLAET